MRMLVVLALLLVPAIAGAQTDGVVAKRTVLDFEGDLVEAKLDSPDVGLIAAQKRLRHASLIRVRDSFDDRIVESVAQLNEARP